ncbi:MAG: hypothetical protein WCD35_19310, partial [Mycobacteriales bacterium]
MTPATSDGRAAGTRRARSTVSPAAPAVIGNDISKENVTACSRGTRSARRAVSVAPDRETPGASAGT